MVYLDQTLQTYKLLHCPATDMQNGDEASSSIIVLAGRGLLVKMLIILETHGILTKFCKLIHFKIVWGSGHWYEKR